MIAVDTNILVYAHRGDSPFHADARRALERLSSTAERWAVSWPSVHEFFSVVTNSRIFPKPTPPKNALAAIADLLEVANVTVLSETDRHWEMLRTIIMDSRIAGPRVHDARIAAICIEHGVRELWSADRDFKRFPGLKVVNPLRD